MSTSLLVYRIGALGDTLVSLPALWTVREHFAGARVTILCNYQVGKRYVLAADLLCGSGIADDYLLYPVDDSAWGKRLRPLRMASLLVKLRRRRFDTLVYLAPSERSAQQIERDRRFFRAAGIKTLIGMVDLSARPERAPGQPLPTVPREADLLLQRLSVCGIPVPPPEQRRLDLAVNEQDEAQVRSWLASLEADGGRRWIAIGPGSKMPAKVWPAEYYQQVVQRLIEREDVWPVIFGGPEDREVGRLLLDAWGRGYNAAGALGLRAASAALRRCALYLGNDTGTMHMAAAASVRCVALFSARGYPGQWYPYGRGHTVFRTPIDCEGCGLEACITRAKECLMRISPEEVFLACIQKLQEPKQVTRPPQ